MASFNKILMMGNLTRDPELRQIPSGATVCTFGLAVNRTYRKANGETGDDVCFIDVTVWGKIGESCATYLKKGSSCFVEGTLRLEQWQDRTTGQNRSRHSISADSVKFLNSGAGRTSSANENRDFGPSPDSYVDAAYSGAPAPAANFASPQAAPAASADFAAPIAPAAPVANAPASPAVPDFTTDIDGDDDIPF